VIYKFVHGWLGGDETTALRADLMANAVVSAHNHVLRRWLRGATDRPERALEQAMDFVLALSPSPLAARSSCCALIRTSRRCYRG